jgi:hypothetical protein
MGRCRTSWSPSEFAARESRVNFDELSTEFRVPDSEARPHNRIAEAVVHADLDEATRVLADQFSTTISMFVGATAGSE